jgi:peptidoglycan hydrolase CwlO-like protein
MAMQPFLNRKGGEDPVVMAAKRQAHLEQMLVDKEKAFRAVKEEEHKKEHDLKNLIPTIERLKGECDLLKRENDKMKTDFTKHAAEFEEFNVHHTLFKMDP